MDKYIKCSDIPFYKIELEERCHNDRWTEIHEVAYKTEIDRIPAADVVPVRHGRWIVTAEFTDCVYAQCDQCKITQVFYHNKPLTNYCPNCGAKMDLYNKEG